MIGDDERTARGEAMFEAVYGGVVDLPPRDQRDAFVTNTVDQLFAETWSRDVLSVGQRRLLIIGSVIASGQTEIAEIQIRAALALGELTVKQVEEIRVFMVNYVGYPLISSFAAALTRAIAAHRADGQT